MKLSFHNLIAVCLLGLVSGCVHFPVANETAFEKLRNNVKSDDTLDLQFGIARLTERNGNPHEAKSAYLEILKDHADHAGALHRMGVMLVKEDQLEEAIPYFESALEYSVQQSKPAPELLGDLGYARFLAGDLDQAETNLLSAHKQIPDDKRILNNLAIVVGLKGDLTRSLALFRSGNPEAEALASFAYVQTRIGDLEGAKRSYHLALESDSSLKVAANGLIELHQKVPTASNPSRRSINHATSESISRRTEPPIEERRERWKLDQVPPTTEATIVSKNQVKLFEIDSLPESEIKPGKTDASKTKDPVVHFGDTPSSPSNALSTERPSRNRVRSIGPGARVASSKTASTKKPDSEKPEASDDSSPLQIQVFDGPKKR